MTGEFRNVQLPSQLCDAAERRFGERFGSLEQFLERVLRELLRDDAAKMDRDEQRIIQQRLEDLGYV